MPDIAVSLRSAGGSVVAGQARNHTVTVDRLEEKGGSDSGPLGVEYLPLALGGCYLSTFLSAPAARRDLFDKPLPKAERGCIVHQSVREAITVPFTHGWL